MVAFMSGKSTSKTEIAALSVPGRAQRLALFGPPPLIEGEDAAAYDELLACVRAAVKPVDIIDEMFIADVVSLEWEVLRCRRLKWRLIRVPGIDALEKFLAGQLGWDMVSEYLEDELTKFLQHFFSEYVPESPEDVAEFSEDKVHALVQACVRNEPHAIDKINKLIEPTDYSVDGELLSEAQRRKARELVQQYLRRKPNAVRLVHRLLAEAGKSMETFMAGALANTLDQTERIDRLITIAENRRNASLREIDRRRASLGEALRRAWKKLQTLSLK